MRDCTMADVDTTNILIVDDLPEKLLVYRSILEELGQNIVTARSARRRSAASSDTTSPSSCSTSTCRA